MASAILTSAKHGAYLAIALLWRGDLAKSRTAPLGRARPQDCLPALRTGTGRCDVSLNPLATVDQAERLGVAGA